MGTISSILPTGATATLPEHFVCPVCGKEPTCKGFANHLNRCLEKHGMTRDEYERLHPETLYSPAHGTEVMAGVALHDLTWA